MATRKPAGLGSPAYFARASALRRGKKSRTARSEVACRRQPEGTSRGTSNRLPAAWPAYAKRQDAASTSSSSPAQGPPFRENPRPGMASRAGTDSHRVHLENKEEGGGRLGTREGQLPAIRTPAILSKLSHDPWRVDVWARWWNARGTASGRQLLECDAAASLSQQGGRSILAHVPFCKRVSSQSDVAPSALRISLTEENGGPARGPEGFRAPIAICNVESVGEKMWVTLIN